MGFVHTENGKSIGVPMRCNIFQDNVEFKQDEQIFVVKPVPQLKKVEFDNHVFIVAEFNYHGKTQKGYMEVLEDGKLILLSKMVVSYVPRIVIQDVPAKFVRQSDLFYYRIGNEGRKCEEDHC